MPHLEQENDMELVNRSDLEKLLAQYDVCPLECDGMTRVILTVLERAAVPHEVWIGDITHISTNNAFSPHFWITVADFRIDYRARMWLGDRDDIPHGVVKIGEHPNVHYRGKQVALPVLSNELFHVLTMENPFKDFLTD